MKIMSYFKLLFIFFILGIISACSIARENVQINNHVAETTQTTIERNEGI